MCNHFPIVDLVSQAQAVQRHLAGQSLDVKLAWLGSRGRLTVQTALKRKFPDSSTVYVFESYVGIGLTCAFFIDGDDLVFFGDHTTFGVP